MLASLRQENARLQQELQGKPHQQHHEDNLDHGLKGQLKKMSHENANLRRILGLGPDESLDNGRLLVGNLQQENAQLRHQLQDAENAAERLQTQLEVLTIEDPSSETAKDSSSKEQVARLKNQLRNAQTLNELLKRHIELNSSSQDANQSFNPELIVDMAREIEHLKEELDQAGNKPKVEGTTESQVDGPPPHAASSSPSAKDRSTINAYKKELRKVEAELDETKQRLKTLQRRLKATEGTVHRQADKIKHYRREMQNSGMGIPATPERARSESHLPRSFSTGMGMLPRPRSLSDFSNLSIDSTASSASVSPAVSEHELAGSDGASFSEFGDTDDADLLKEQIGVLKNQLQRLRRAVRHLQRRLRASEGSRSRSPSPARSLNDSWFELTANQDAFEKLHQELDHLKEQLNQTNAANMTLQETNLELHVRLSSQSQLEGSSGDLRWHHRETQTDVSVSI